ncbi:MAG: hypothetical protein R6V12_18720, partial [Candidatus Hydrogenedentota bacterium]
LYTGQVDRKIRDALGRGRTADLFIKVGMGGMKADYDKENASLGEMFGKIGIEYGFDKLPKVNHKYKRRNGTIKLENILLEKQFEGSTEEIQEQLKSIGITRSKQVLSSNITRSK